jgi:hypothetical protein
VNINTYWQTRPRLGPTAEAVRAFLAAFRADIAAHPVGEEVQIGLGRVVALYYRSSTSYQIH